MQVIFIFGVNMNKKLFELALEKARPSDWEHFEELSSGFLSSEFDKLRTMAAASGDGGRDSELFSPDNITYVALQYSVAKDFNSKISKTITRLQENFDHIKVLIYCTNKQIGADADELRGKCISKGISLDIRDKNWFLERYQNTDTNYDCASQLVNVIARPLLESEAIIEKSRPALTTMEAKVALTYLGMQWEDESTNKGLTKIAFESLVRAALRKTSSENRLTRAEVHEAVLLLTPSNEHNDIVSNVDSALNKFNKTVVRHWTKEDEFCLTHDEVLRLQDRVVEAECDELNFRNAIERLLENEKEEGDQIDIEDLSNISERIARVVDKYLIAMGESFATAVAHDDICLSDRNLLNNCIFSDINDFPPSDEYVINFPDIALNVIARLLSSELPAVKTHLKKISDTYTLYAFLKETPDVQDITKKIFSHGKIWLDTTIVLPFLAEAFFKEGKDKRYTEIAAALVEAGVELRVTAGVIREVIQHINISSACSNKHVSEWNGRIPFLYYHYIEQGYEAAKFSSITEVFHGEDRPEDDIEDYLKQNFGILLESLEDAVETVDEDVRYRIDAMWTDAHRKRRTENGGGNVNIDETVTDALIKHDVESYVGVIGKRKNEKVSELGYEHWWLTTDKLAWKIRNELKKEFDHPPSSPLMSLDFLANSLSFGPVRGKFDRDQEQLLPLFYEVDASEYMPKELIEIANRVREKYADSPEHVIRRKVRDTCDRMKRRYGSITKSAEDLS